MCVCVRAWCVGGSRMCFTIMLCRGGGGEYRSLISTDGFVNLQEGPLRFGLSVNQTNSAGTVCVCFGGGVREECVQSVCLALSRLKWRSMRNHRR